MCCPPHSSSRTSHHLTLLQRLLQSIIQSKDIVVHVVRIGSGRNKLKHFTKVQWIRIGTPNADRSRYKNDHGISRCRWLHVHGLDLMNDLADFSQLSQDVFRTLKLFAFECKHGSWVLFCVCCALLLYEVTRVLEEKRRDTTATNQQANHVVTFTHTHTHTQNHQKSLLEDTPVVARTYKPAKLSTLESKL